MYLLVFGFGSFIFFFMAGFIRWLSKRTSRRDVSRHGVDDKSDSVQCKILLLDGSDITANVHRKAHGDVLYERVFFDLDIVEKDYFALQFTDHRNVNQWLDPKKKIRKQVTIGPPYTFRFRVKFYSSDPTVNLKEEVTRYQLFLQLKQDICSGKLLCEDTTAVELAALALQSELGDYDPTVHSPALVSEFRFFPEQTESMELKILEEYKKCKGQTPARAEMNYLSKAKLLDLYGTDIHEVQGRDGNPYLLGLTPIAILIFEQKHKIGSFVWPNITQLQLKSKKLILGVIETSSEGEQQEHTFIFRCHDQKACKHLWKCAIEYHVFFRLRPDKSRPVSRQGFLRLGSRFGDSARAIRTEVSNTMQNRASRRGSRFERKPSQRFSRRDTFVRDELQRKALTTAPDIVRSSVRSSAGSTASGSNRPNAACAASANAATPECSSSLSANATTKSSGDRHPVGATAKELSRPDDSIDNVTVEYATSPKSGKASAFEKEYTGPVSPQANDRLDMNLLANNNTVKTVQKPRVLSAHERQNNVFDTSSEEIGDAYEKPKLTSRRVLSTVSESAELLRNTHGLDDEPSPSSRSGSRSPRTPDAFSENIPDKSASVASTNLSAQSEPLNTDDKVALLDDVPSPAATPPPSLQVELPSPQPKPAPKSAAVSAISIEVNNPSPPPLPSPDLIDLKTPKSTEKTSTVAPEIIEADQDGFNTSAVFGSSPFTPPLEDELDLSKDTFFPAEDSSPTIPGSLTVDVASDELLESASTPMKNGTVMASPIRPPLSPIVEEVDGASAEEMVTKKAANKERKLSKSRIPSAAVSKSKIPNTEKEKISSTEENCSVPPPNSPEKPETSIPKVKKKSKSKSSLPKKSTPKSQNSSPVVIETSFDGPDVVTMKQSKDTNSQSPAVNESKPSSTTTEKHRPMAKPPPVTSAIEQTGAKMSSDKKKTKTTVKANSNSPDLDVKATKKSNVDITSEEKSTEKASPSDFNSNPTTTSSITESAPKTKPRSGIPTTKSASSTSIPRARRTSHPSSKQKQNQSQMRRMITTDL